MLKKKNNNAPATSVLVYVASVLFILGWWYCGFANKPAGADIEVSFLKKSESKTELEEILAPFSRDDLKRALGGDLELMASLITEWDQDAQILESRGFLEVARLSRRDFVRALLLGRKLKGKKEVREERYLPQTWAAARFLMALLPKEQIVAIPEGLANRHPEIPIPPLKGEWIETISHEKPTCAFVAPYSHPGALQALRDHQVSIHSAPTLLKIDDIFTELQAMGNIVNKADEAELLTLFIRSALLAIDNRAKLLDPYEKTFYLSWGTYFSYPTARTITGQLLARLHLNTELRAPSGLAWKIPLDSEALAALRPSKLILACENPEKGHSLTWGTPLKVALVEEGLMESIDQYLVLAYYDIYEALKR
jgi:iron complex transport system substrate-binding protein